jgi:hypothetical protein
VCGAWSAKRTQFTCVCSGGGGGGGGRGQRMAGPRHRLCSAASKGHQGLREDGGNDFSSNARPQVHEGATLLKPLPTHQLGPARAISSAEPWYASSCRRPAQCSRRGGEGRRDYGLSLPTAITTCFYGIDAEAVAATKCFICQGSFQKLRPFPSGPGGASGSTPLSTPCMLLQPTRPSWASTSHHH